MNGILPTDSELLREFVASGDDRPFELLVRRYGALVLGVCRGVLHDATDADDAAQASFLLLARRANSLKGRPTIAGWLHSVAWNIASRARRARDRRRQREHEAAGMFERSHAAQTATRSAAAAASSNEAFAELHEALCALSEKYRLPLILHHLRGWSEPEVAEILGTNVGTVSSRLSRGRAMLRARLEKHRSSLIGASAISAQLDVEIAMLEAPMRDPKSQPSETFLAMTLGIATAGAKGSAATSIAAAQAFALASNWTRMVSFAYLRWTIAGLLLTAGTTAAVVGLMAQRSPQGISIPPPIATDGTDASAVVIAAPSGRTDTGGGAGGQGSRRLTFRLATVKAQDAVAEAMGTINGTLADPQGNAVAGASVKVYLSADDARANRKLVAVAVTGDDGGFRFQTLRPRKLYHLVFTTTRPAPMRMELEAGVNADQPNDIGKVVLKRAR